MKNTLIACALCVVVGVAAHLVGVSTSDVFITMIAYNVFLDRLEKQDEE